MFLGQNNDIQVQKKNSNEIINSPSSTNNLHRPWQGHSINFEFNMQQSVWDSSGNAHIVT